MSKRKCTVVEIKIDGQPGVRAECSYCDHTTESLGTTEKSRKRCLVLMKEECPQDEDNYYEDDGG